MAAIQYVRLTLIVPSNIYIISKHLESSLTMRKKYCVEHHLAIMTCHEEKYYGQKTFWLALIKIKI